jgi:hypothetical protein
MKSTEPSHDDLRTVCDMASGIADGDDNGENQALVQNVEAWLEALEILTPDAELALAQAVIAKHKVTHPNQGNEISQVLTLSTSHLTEKTIEGLEAGETFGQTIFEKGDYGWWVYVGIAPVTDCMPIDLASCMVKALHAQCEWICFDSDGPVNPNLPTFDW